MKTIQLMVSSEDDEIHVYNHDGTEIYGITSISITKENGCMMTADISFLVNDKVLSEPIINEIVEN